MLAKHPGGHLVEGVAKRLTPTLEQFVELLGWMKPRQALCFGTFAGTAESLVVSQKHLRKRQNNTKGLVIARDREHFSWPEGPGVLMLDYDPEPGKTPYSRDDLLRVLYSAWPALESAPHIWAASASSCIHRIDTGEELRGLNGQRVYIPVLDATDIPRTGFVLSQRLWLAGHGRYDVSKSGALLERSIIDGAVWQPERLDFSGGAFCGAGLEQRRPKPILFNTGAQFV